MSAAGAIERGGTRVVWRRMAGSSGAYNPATSKVTTSSPAADVEISAVIDGYSLSGYAAEVFAGNTLLKSGSKVLFVSVAVEEGDVIIIAGEKFTVAGMKEVWKKNEVVMRALLVSK